MVSRLLQPARLPPWPGLMPPWRARVILAAPSRLFPPPGSSGRARGRAQMVPAEPSHYLREQFRPWPVRPFPARVPVPDRPEESYLLSARILLWPERESLPPSVARLLFGRNLPWVALEQRLPLAQPLPHWPAAGQRLARAPR